MKALSISSLILLPVLSNSGTVPSIHSDNALNLNSESNDTIDSNETAGSEEPYQSPYPNCSEVPDPEPCYPGDLSDCLRFSTQARIPFLQSFDPNEHHFYSEHGMDMMVTEKFEYCQEVLDAEHHK